MPPAKQLRATVHQWISQIDIHNSQIAHLLCYLIPAQCPFARTIGLGRFSITIPPLCHLNPFYESLMTLRFRALLFLTESGEDIARYCC
ncbi:MAG: nitrogenase [Synechococcales cyanobacterium C42_A2020_086]|nr:nitrogenase [Synechococcales cyanobacterium M58_A2018_015]MBF2072567.1 nitrogenase [Synechococcales cyanobacterium C42_A2020_086]